MRSLNTFILAIAVLVLQGCEKYVDIKKSSQQDLVQTASDCQLILNNYANMNTDYPSDGEASSDDYFLSGQSYISLNLEDQGVYSWQKASIRQGASPYWQSPYKVVFLSNLVLETVNKLQLDNTIDQSTVADIKGQALFFRAYALWNLAQLYCKQYETSTAENDLGIPLRSSSDINEISFRETNKATYDKIISDLKQSIDGLSLSTVVQTRPSKVAAYAMLARVYLSMQDYTNALTYANLALQIKSDLINYNSISTTAQNPFSRFNTEVIFHSIMSTSNLLKPGTQNSPNARIDQSLVNSYDANDLRRKIFLKPNNVSVRNPGTGSITSIPDGTFRFGGNYEPANSGNANQFNGLAVDEILLVRAECLARDNKLSEALIDLNTLLSNRYQTGTFNPYQTSDKEQALSKILLERRKELLMRSLRWSDLKRLNKDTQYVQTLERNIVFIPSTDPNISTPPPLHFTLEPNDIRYVLLIPQQVITNSSIIQNAR